jgi:hypothetical protein
MSSKSNSNCEVHRGDDDVCSDTSNIDGPLRLCASSDDQDSRSIELDGPCQPCLDVTDDRPELADGAAHAHDGMDGAASQPMGGSWMPRLDFANNSTTLMPNAVTVAELQHICDNAQSLVHTELEHWAVFWREIKNWEALLGSPERMRRYIWTCVRRSKYAWAENKLLGFSATLYEKRWKEVVNFLKAFNPLLNVIR